MSCLISFVMMEQALDSSCCIIAENLAISTVCPLHREPLEVRDLLELGWIGLIWSLPDQPY